MGNNFLRDQIPDIIGQIIFTADSKMAWEMEPAERSVLIMLLSQIRPECTIEIGTANGGSLSVLSNFSQQVYSLDIDPTCYERLIHKFANVEFITGKSQETLEPLLNRLQKSGSKIVFVLIDGTNMTEGVRQDIESIIRIQPAQPVFIVIHDSFYPDCRAGIYQADWSASPYVHFVEVDFVPGIFHTREGWSNQMWGGVCLGHHAAGETGGKSKNLGHSRVAISDGVPIFNSLSSATS